MLATPHIKVLFGTTARGSPHDLLVGHPISFQMTICQLAGMLRASILHNMYKARLHIDLKQKSIYNIAILDVGIFEMIFKP